MHREILFALSGRSFRGYCGHIYEVKPGTVILHNTMEPHDLNYPRPHPDARHLLISFYSDICYVHLLSVGRGRKTHGFIPKWSILYPLGSLGLASASVLFPDPISDAPLEFTRSRCINALKLLFSAMIEKMYCSNAPCCSQHEHVVQAAVRYIKENHGRNCSLRELAEVLGYSRFHFCRLFRDYMRVSLGDYVKQVRIQSFRQMLEEGKQLKTIAHALGFAHLSALSRWRRENHV